MSMPCFSRSSLWAKVQSTGSTGVSADGVFSLSALACSGWLNRNTWFFPIMIRLPERNKHETRKLAKTLLLQCWKNSVTVRAPTFVFTMFFELKVEHHKGYYEPHCITMIYGVQENPIIWIQLSIVIRKLVISFQHTEIIQILHLQIIYNFIYKNEMHTWTKLDCILNTLAVDIGFWSLAGHQHDNNFNKNIPTNHQWLNLKSSSSLIFKW